MIGILIANPKGDSGSAIGLAKFMEQASFPVMAIFLTRWSTQRLQGRV